MASYSIDLTPALRALNQLGDDERMPAEVRRVALALLSHASPDSTVVSPGVERLRALARLARADVEDSLDWLEARDLSRPLGGTPQDTRRDIAGLIALVGGVRRCLARPAIHAVAAVRDALGGDRGVIALDVAMALVYAAEPHLYAMRLNCCAIARSIGRSESHVRQRGLTALARVGLITRLDDGRYDIRPLLAAVDAAATSGATARAERASTSAAPTSRPCAIVGTARGFAGAWLRDMQAQARPYTNDEVEMLRAQLSSSQTLTLRDADAPILVYDIVDVVAGAA